MIIGSTAAVHHGVHFGKEISDLDIMVYDEEMLSVYPSRVDSHIVPKEIYDLIYDPSGYMSPELLLTLKMSHLPWDIKWYKTKRHIIALLNLGYEPDMSAYHTLKNYWTEVHGDKSFLSLKKEKDDFFDDHVVCKYDHDYLHSLVAYPNEPMYTRCLADGESVMISESKFRGLSHVNQVRMFREEVTVIAIERWLTNDVNKGRYSWYESYSLSLKKTITTLTKNWANDFMIMNVKELSKPQYELFENALRVLGVKMSEVDLELFEKIAENCNDSVENIIYEMCEGDTREGDVEGLATYEHIEQDGGGEGGGEYCYGVFKLNGVIYKAEYSYYSYEGHDIDGIVSTLRVVTPVEKTVTVYE